MTDLSTIKNNIDHLNDSNRLRQKSINKRARFVVKKSDAKIQLADILQEFQVMYDEMNSLIKLSNSMFNALDIIQVETGEDSIKSIIHAMENNHDIYFHPYPEEEESCYD